MSKEAAYHLDRYLRFAKLAEEQEAILEGMSKEWTYSRWAIKIKIRNYHYMAQQHQDQYNQIVLHSFSQQ